MATLLMAKIFDGSFQNLFFTSFQSNTEVRVEAESQFEADARLKTNSTKTMFSADEIEASLISNAFLLFFGGFEMSSTGLALVRFVVITITKVGCFCTGAKRSPREA